jgi:hypothetical protein
VHFHEKEARHAFSAPFAQPCQSIREYPEAVMRSRFADGARFVLLFVLVLSGMLVSNAPAQRRTPTIPPELRSPTYRDFDVVPTSYDAGGFRLNPKWGKQAREGDNALPSPTESCPIDDADTLHWTSSPQWPNCRSNPVSFNWSFWCSRHANFEPVSYTGAVRWGGTGDTGADWFPAGDSDYELNMFRPDQVLYSTAGRQIHLEFDSRETVDQWDNTDTWWKQFHEYVAAGDSRVHDIDNHSAYVIGMLGLDTFSTPGFGHAPASHGKTELHPVYAMFVLVDQDQRRKQARWAFFIRNWGNEGYCGASQVKLYQQLITVRLRDATAVLSPYVWHGARQFADASELSSMSVGVRSTEAGIDLDFGLLTPDRESWIMGDLVVQQRLPVEEFTRGDAARALTASEPAERPPQFATIQAEIDKLPESARKELRARQSSVVFRRPGTRLALTTLPAGAADRESSAASAAKTEPVVRMGEDPIGVMNRRREGEALKAFLATRGVRVNLPPER